MKYSEEAELSDVLRSIKAKEKPKATPMHRVTTKFLDTGSEAE